MAYQPGEWHLVGANVRSNRCRAAFVDVNEVSSPVCPAKSQLKQIFLPAFIGQGVIAGVSIHLQTPLKPWSA
jgi:hypothetical protein